MKKQNKNLDKAINALKNEAVPTSPPQEVIDATLQKLGETGYEPQAGVIKERIKITERIKAMKTFTKLAAAAALILIAVFTITLLDRTVTPAYAIEQTIEAMKNIVTVHFFATDWQDREMETWIKVNPETGENDYHYLNEPERGQISISSPEITHFYHPKENKVRIVEGQALRSDIRFGRFIEDIVDKVIEPENGELQVIKEHDPNTGEEVIVLWAESPNYEMEAFIDPETKLPIKMNFARATPGQIIKSVDEIYYNEPLPEGLFDFEIPDGAEVIREQRLWPVIDDPKYGICAEGITKDEARVKIIKEFWGHVINKDFESAHMLLPVASIERFKEVFGELGKLGGVVELISIGEPFEKANINFGILTPVQVRFSDGTILELYQITHFRRIDGKLSCVLAGEGQKSKRIE